MTTAAISPAPSTYASDDARWQAVLARDSSADGHFVYAVRSTGVYAPPSAPARRPRRDNVQFFDTAAAAEAAGFRASRHARAQPARAALAAEACRLIEAADDPPALQALAARLGASPFHLHRVFKAETGLTPKAYASATRARRLRGELAAPGSTVTQALYGAGFGSSSRFYDSADALLGMQPSAWRAGGAGTEIRFAVGQCTLGAILVAQSARGICAIALGDDPDALVRGLQDQFPAARLLGGDAAFEQLVAQVVGFVQAPALGLQLPLDVRGTAFQQRVWQALREVPAGATVSYTEIAERIGAPQAVRAVAQACGANRIAVAIPCHRVVRRDGALSGYRWGVERKRALLASEAAA
jgi:AraC family transcriptional regulator of adaptative response/methylated-DNA-[protein]-cysteine methyltransferase